MTGPELKAIKDALPEIAQYMDRAAGVAVDLARFAVDSLHASRSVATLGALTMAAIAVPDGTTEEEFLAAAQLAYRAMQGMQSQYGGEKP